MIVRRAREVLGRTIATTPDPENPLRGPNAIHRNVGLALASVVACWVVVWLLRYDEELGCAKVLCPSGLGSSAR